MVFPATNRPGTGFFSASSARQSTSQSMPPISTNMPESPNGTA